MKPLGYQEVCWHISLAPSTDLLTIAAFDQERDVLQATDRSSKSFGMPIELSGLIKRSDPSTPRWIRSRVSMDEADRVGKELWSAVPPSIRAGLPTNGHVRLKISSDVPAAADLPWEWLTDGDGPPFALRPDFSIVRSVPIPFPVHPLSVELPLHVVVLAPNPVDESPLDTSRETEALVGALDSPHYSVRHVDAPDIDWLGDALYVQEPNVVHFVGHAGLAHGEGNLILQDPDGRSRWVSATELAGILPTSVRLLCLATPLTTDNYQVLGLTHLARASVSTGLPTTIANQYPVSDDAVRAFWATFYAALVEHGGNVTDAVQAARAQVAAIEPSDADWASFTLTIRDQTGVSFEFRSIEATPERKQLEIQARFAAQAANELAEQLEVLGDATPDSLRRQYVVEQDRVTKLLGDLSE